MGSRKNGKPRTSRAFDLTLTLSEPCVPNQLKVMHYADLEARLAAGDTDYVPRAPHYRKLLWAHCKRVYG